MFRKVLVALDFSAYSQKIFDCISEIPGIQEVVLLHVVDATHPSKLGWTSAPYIENAKLLMAEKKEALEHLGLKVHDTGRCDRKCDNPGYCFPGDPGSSRNPQGLAYHHGCPGHQPDPGDPAGQCLVIRAPACKDQCPGHALQSREGRHRCMLVTRPAQKLFSRILVPTDFSPSARDALSFIKTIPAVQDDRSPACRQPGRIGTGD